ncbi:MAG: bifunctional (p)ppGpp synthetase/guanosine-3',5'-bis(diphosphate) 3'-pyrophosphohydrolase [Alphaproteobacteria bacterium]|nr:bifunctional (p)ppGpp synthetase/guanosine-3',5'-bis(diphosphate) 3'-pyrophosphohydrolase [Alphaproteobacteria bacterium]
MKMHAAQKRESGDPYFSHPLEVAEILISYRMDYATIIAALLHDTVEDTAASYEDLKELFGQTIADLVRGMTKLSKLEITPQASKQAQNFQKLVLAISEDIRVLLIKLADRLHNMRSLHIRAQEKRIRIATETLEIYVPLAERMGMQAIKDELEDYCFLNLYPDAHKTIVSRLKFLSEQGKEDVAQVIKKLEEDLKEHGIEATVKGREKRPYSIWHKMQLKNIPFEQVCDIIAFRIIVNSIEDCYKALGVIHTKYPMIGGRYKDYISTPKQNGYRSLHTGVIGPLNRRIEVQIRTKEMNDVAEMGVAAHWEYKQGSSKEGTQYRWLRDLLDLMNRCSDPNDFLEHTKIALYQDQVFCFSPKGDLITLPKGATAIDFAYAVHSRVGDTCVGAKINGKIIPLRTELQNGDQVEVLTNKSQTPSPEWEHIAVTAKAKASIRRYIRTLKYEQNVQTARNQFINEAKEFGLTFTDKDLQPLLPKYKSFLKADQEQVTDLLAAIGAGVVSFKDVFHELHPDCSRSTLKKALSIFKKKEGKTSISDKNMPVTGLIPGIALNFAKCCHPLPGDSIVGIVTTGKGVTIHTADCSSLRQYQDEPERWLPIEWNAAVMQDKVLPARLLLEVEDKPTVLSEITNIAAKQNVVITNLKLQNRKNGISEILLEIEVKNSSSLDVLIQSLRSSEFVSLVHRLKV